jgi:hypothetical protein
VRERPERFGAVARGAAGGRRNRADRAVALGPIGAVERCVTGVVAGQRGSANGSAIMVSRRA